ncbi:hypothetical protein [Aeromonas hydrophila]|uniref:hypothetical protein n=1 Tax=Aeromonas hydrophila TaxID=644 RepID=UPI0038CFF7AC
MAFIEMRVNREGVFCPLAANVGSKRHLAGSGPKNASEALQTFRQQMPCLGSFNAPKPYTGG